LALLINGILDICVYNQSQGYGVFKLNFMDILKLFYAFEKRKVILKAKFSSSITSGAKIGHGRKLQT
jgi:hypothetical protein